MWALCLYVDRTANFRRKDQLFVSWATSDKGKPLSSQRLSLWVVEAGGLIYRVNCALCQGHGSWALFKQTLVEDICAVVSWPMSNTGLRGLFSGISEWVKEPYGFRRLCNPGVGHISQSETQREIRKRTLGYLILSQQHQLLHSWGNKPT